MTKKMSAFLSGAAIHALGDSYVGTIAAVEERSIRNRWTTQVTTEDVLVFADGKLLVLNQAMRLELLARFGSESEDWVGGSISLGTRRVERQGSAVWERVLLPVEPSAQVKDAASRFGRKR